MNPTFRLVMQTGPTPGRDIPLQKSELFIGRDLNNDIVINDAEVSRRHARIFLHGTGYMMEDLGSTNGSFINGSRITSPTALRPGEIITLGERINLVFESLVFSPPTTISPEPQSAAPATMPKVEPIPSPIVEPPVRQAPPARNPAPRSEPVKPSSYAGHVPTTPHDDPQPVKTRIPTWVWVVIGIETFLLIFLIIDDARLWCPLFGWVIDAIFPGSCTVGNL